MFPVADDDVNTTFPPLQNVVEPLAVIVGFAGLGITVIVVPAEGADIQAPPLLETVYVPEVDTTIDCVVAPVDQTFPVATEDVNVVLPPSQKLVEPLTLIVGAVGGGVIVTVTGFDCGELQVPLFTVTQ